MCASRTSTERRVQLIYCFDIERNVEEHLEPKFGESDETPESSGSSKRAGKSACSAETTHPPPQRHLPRTAPPHRKLPLSNYNCVTILFTPDVGERMTLTSDRSIAEEVFPEIADALSTNERGNATWNTDLSHLARFPLSGYCKLNPIQVIQRRLNSGFTMAASNGGGIESQHFKEYLCTRAVRTS